MPIAAKGLGRWTNLAHGHCADPTITAAWSVTLHACVLRANTAVTAGRFTLFTFYNFILYSYSQVLGGLMCRPLCTGVKRQMPYVSASSWLAVSAARDIGCFGDYLSRD